MSRKWLQFMCVVTFDVEYGQKLEVVLPSSTALTPEEKLCICFSSFPDSHSRKCSDSVFSFRYQYSRNPARHRFGYVFFRQAKDPSVERGYLQKSVVLVSPYGFFGLFEKMVSIMGPLFFEKGLPLLEVVVSSMDKWPLPATGKKFDLPLLGYVFNVSIPAHIPKSTEFTMSSLSIANPSEREFGALLFFDCTGQFHESRLCEVFTNHLNLLWTFWELMLTGQTLLVVSQNPAACAHCVYALISLISPLRIGLDYRPYFTIHDPEFKEYVSEASRPHVLIGVSNPYFLKAREWPNVLLLGEDEKEADDGAVHQQRAKPKPQFISKARVYVRKSKEVLKQLQTPSRDSRIVDPKLEATNDYILRRYFLRLNERFLYPLDRYLTTLLPTAASMVPFHGEPALKTFRNEEFLKFLQASENGLKQSLAVTLGPSFVEIYRGFLSGPNFLVWHTHRCKQACQDIHRTYRHVIMTTDIVSFTEGKVEVEVVDLYLKIREMIEAEAEDASYARRLKHHLKVVVGALPADLQTSLQHSAAENRKNKLERRELRKKAKDQKQKLKEEKALKEAERNTSIEPDEDERKDEPEQLAFPAASKQDNRISDEVVIHSDVQVSSQAHPSNQVSVSEARVPEIIEDHPFEVNPFGEGAAWGGFSSQADDLGEF